MLRHHRPLPLPPRAAAREQNNEHAEEKRDKCSDEKPYGNAEIRMATTPIVVDMVSDDAEQGEIGG